METCSKTEGEEGYGASVVCNTCDKIRQPSSSGSNNTIGSTVEEVPHQTKKRKSDEKGGV